jgi:DNA ligase D-like protein (predicted ligase)
VLPGLIIPMEPRPCPEPFDSPRHLFQVKWDGVRMLAFVAAGAVRLQNRRLRDRTAQYPDLQALAAAVGDHEAVVDGEVVAFDGRRPSFAVTLRRDLAGSADRAAWLARRHPVTFMAFDLVYLDGRDLRPEPLEARLSALDRLLGGQAAGGGRPGGGGGGGVGGGGVGGGGVAVVVESFAGGRALFDAVVQANLEGVVAKARGSPYVAGKRSSHWLKFKHRRRQLCAVGGYIVSGGRPAALLMGAYAGDRLVYIGRVGSGLSERDRDLLAPVLAADRGPCPFDPPPRLPPAARRWVAPRLVAVVRFAEWTEGMHMRAPSLEGFSDQPPAACRL